MAVDFFVRIFIYGLAAFVPNDAQTTVLLPSVPEHHAFVAFPNDAGSCSPNPCQRIGSKSMGVMLTGDQIDIPDLTSPSPAQVHQRAGRLPFVGSLPPGFPKALPFFVEDGTAFDWVPPMAKIVNNPTADPDCLSGASTKCNAGKGLQARFVLTSGMLSTCNLVETGSDPNSTPPCKGEVHSFTFQPSNHPDQQALAEIEVDVTQMTASGLTLKLSKLGANTPWETITFKPPTPGTCVGAGDKKAACLDIFIGNMTKPTAADCSVQATGDHFTYFYPLLASTANSKPIPNQDTTNSMSATDVQPVCQDVPSGFTVAQKSFKARDTAEFQALAQLSNLRPLTADDRRRHAAFNAYLDASILFPHQVAICPMVTLTHP
jgi:hypothetical protein